MGYKNKQKCDIILRCSHKVKMQNRELSILQEWIEVKQLSRGSDAGGEFLKMDKVFSRLISEEVIWGKILLGTKWLLQMGANKPSSRFLLIALHSFLIAF